MKKEFHWWTAAPLLLESSSCPTWLPALWMSDLLCLYPQWCKPISCNKSLPVYTSYWLPFWITPDWYSFCEGLMQAPREWSCIFWPRNHGPKNTLGKGVLKGHVFGCQDGVGPSIQPLDGALLNFLQLSFQPKAGCIVSQCKVHSLWRRLRWSPMPKLGRLNWTHLTSMKKWSPEG